MSVDAYAHTDISGRDPLIFAFHGTGGDERQLLPLAREIWPDSAVVAPRGDVSERGALRFFRRQAEGVYDFDDLARATAQMAAFVRAHKATSNRRTLGVGYSNGANILASVALAEPGLFDEIALLHPLIPWRPSDDARLGRTRVLISAGRRDPICPPAETSALADFWTAQGAEVTLAWHDGGHELRESEIAALRRWASDAAKVGATEARRST